MKVYKKGGKKNKSKFRKVSEDRLQNISDRQNAPIERLLRRIGKRKKERAVTDPPDAGEETVCTEEGCYVKPSKDTIEAYNDPKNQPKDPLSLRIADFIARKRVERQEDLASKKSKAQRRATLATDPRRGEYREFRNPFARARYRSLQRREARSKGRSAAGQGLQYIQSPEF